MEIFLGWIIFSFIVGLLGSDRKIGFWGSFLLSIILSPLIGIIFALISESNSTVDYKKELLKIQQETLHQSKTQEPVNRSVIEELEKLSLLKEKNIITNEEFLNLKSNLLSNNGNFKPQTENDPSIYYFFYGIDDMNIPSVINKRLQSNSDELLYQIQKSEKFIKLYECNEYPFYAALILDERKVKIPNLHINQLEILSKKYFHCDSINDTLQKIKKNNTKSNQDN